jgi:cysteine-rich repeat protein
VASSGRAALACSALLGASIVVAACGSKETVAGPPRPTTSSSSVSGGIGGDDPSGVGGAGGAGGDTGGAPPEGCGDGAIVFPELCDGKDLGGATCKDVGYEGGVLSCAKDCQLDETKCTRKEQCSDGLDNDQDGKTDCGDSECAAACAASCTSGAITVIAQPVFVFSGDTTGHANELNASCSALSGSSSGPELVYQITASFTGVLDLQLVSDADLGVSVRTACAQQGTELACADRVSGPHSVERLKLAVTKDELVFIAVQGYGPADAGSFSLSVSNRAPVCGDGFTDATEQCDDGNVDLKDGCDDKCQVESSETEPNGTSATANAYTSPWYGRIASAGDVDVIKIVLASPATLHVTLGDFDGGCQSGALDSYLEILDKNGSTLLTTDDDGGVGACSSAQAGGLAAGTYYARVSASPKAVNATFAYKLVATTTTDTCGDGVVTGGEQCDDANLAAGDGCSAVCQLEITEKEPNNTAVVANAYAASWRAQIAPVGDVDYLAVNVPVAGSSLTAEVTDSGTGDCLGLAIVSHIDILGLNGATVLASGNGTSGNYCAYAMATGLPAGKYFVRVNASTLAQAGVSDTFSYGLNVTVQ